MFSVLLLWTSLAILNSKGYEIDLLSSLEEDPGEYNLELDSGINYGSDAYKFTHHVKKLSLMYETTSEIITQMDAHNSLILALNLKLDPYTYGSVLSVTGYTGEVLLDVWVKSGAHPAVGLRYVPVNTSTLETLSFGPVHGFRKQQWSKLALHIYRIGVFQSVVDIYVNCERIGRKITRSVLDLFAYKKRFVTRRLEFRIGQKGFGKNVYSRFRGSMQDFQLVFKRDIKTYTEKTLCKFPYQDKNPFLPYARALTEPIRDVSLESAAVTELLSLVKDLRYDLTIQAAQLTYVRKLIEGCEMCRVTNFCAMKPCYPGVHCYHSPKSKRGFLCGDCPFGSYGNGINCTDIDECKLNPCSLMTKCINKSPGYECEPCPEGYAGNAQSGIGLIHAARNQQVCSDVDECLIDNGGCSKLVKCVNTQGSFDCEPCPPGYVGDPQVECRFLQYCSPENPKSNPCSRFAKCHSFNGGRDFSCYCRVGFAGNGFLCGFDKDVDGYPDQQLNCTEKFCMQRSGEGHPSLVQCYYWRKPEYPEETCGDNCNSIANSDQLDKDGDGIGDVCDRDMDNDGIPNKRDNCRWVRNVGQRDFDRDGHGNLCDNCPNVKNPDQEDYDEDGHGDACDQDIDGDGSSNDKDNCPNVVNVAQKDTDGDGVGDACDNCMDVFNPDQADSDSDLLGDGCDNNLDSDKDGIEDNIDNCVLQSNPEQADADLDGVGDICDEDDDNDSVFDKSDNCPLVSNKDQRDSDASGVGDVCKGDWDGDGVPDAYDASKKNNKITFTDFRILQNVNLDPNKGSQKSAAWIVKEKGTEVTQTANSGPGLAVGHDRFAGVDFNGTMYVNSKYDDDYIGFIFSYQDSSSFYAVVWKKTEQVYWNEYPFRAFGTSGLQLKRVKSSSGPGHKLRNALWHTGHTEDEVKLLWADVKQAGWESHVHYHWELIHRPELGLIRIKFYEEMKPFADTGYIHDDTFAGGRMGFYAFSQADIFWSSLSYQANDDMPEDYDGKRLYKGKKTKRQV